MAVSTKMAIIALMMEAARTSETLVNFYQATRGYIPEDSHLHFLTCFSAEKTVTSTVYLDILEYYKYTASYAFTKRWCTTALELACT
jgi:Na+/phosphate symporter